tara:strand:- start:62 stop:238 length:177 start_codon:yes stop_codon:yes gene_type:complete
MNVAKLRTLLTDYPDNAEIRLLKGDWPVDLKVSYTSDDETKKNADYVIFTEVAFDTEK